MFNSQKISGGVIHVSLMIPLAEVERETHFWSLIDDDDSKYLNCVFRRVRNKWHDRHTYHKGQRKLQRRLSMWYPEKEADCSRTSVFSDGDGLMFVGRMDS